jgi:lysozyme family protein
LRNAAKLVQRTVGVADDGVIGPATVKAVNETANMAQKYSDARKAYYTKISENGQNAKFLAGWLKRVDNINKALA